MQRIHQNNKSILKLITTLFIAILTTGCISAKSKPTDVAVPAEPVDAVVDTVVGSRSGSTWPVITGDSLWTISSEEEVYNVPENWPLIYKANLDQIKDADLIYPGQILTIPRNARQSEIDAAIKHARTRGAWTVGPVEESDKKYLGNSG